MRVPKLGISKNGKPMHYSVGALIKNDNNEYLLIGRAKPPFGNAGIAGHIDEDEEIIFPDPFPEEEVGCDDVDYETLSALMREVKEESSYTVEKYKLLFKEELDGNQCSKGIDVHYWYLFCCTVSGKIKRNYAETKSIGWYSVDKIKELTLEPVWEYWFKRMKLI